MRILLVEADRLTLSQLTDALTSQGHKITPVGNSQRALELALAQTYELILLNTQLSDLDGVHLCRHLRRQGYQKPILLLVEDASSDGIAGLEAGADDYVIKPYTLPDLLVRVQVLLQRQSLVSSPVLLYWEALCLNATAIEVTYRGQPVSLTPKEFNLLELFLRNPQRVFSRTAILDRIWSFDVVPNESTVTNHIKELRQKLKAAGLAADVIETVYGLGYRLKPPPKPLQASGPLPPPGEDGMLQTQDIPPKILVVDEDPGVITALRYLLQPWGLAISGLQDATQLWERLNAIAPDLLILDLGLSHLNGADLCQRVRQDERWGNLPILVITTNTRAEAIRQAFAAGADDFVSKPIVGPELVTRVVSRLEQRRTWQKGRSQLAGNQTYATGEPVPEVFVTRVQNTYGNILLVDDQPENLRTLSKILSQQGYKVRKALSGAMALAAIESQPPDLIVLDVRMPEMNGYEVCASLKARAATRDIPIVFVSALDATADKLKAFTVGGVDYITKPFQAEEVLARIKHQLIILQQQRQLTLRYQQLHQEIQKRQRSEVTLTQMQVSEARWQTIFDRISLPLGLLDLNGHWLRLNPCLCELLGDSEAELLHTPMAASFQLENSESPLFPIQEWFSPETAALQLELTCCPKTGAEIRVSLAALVLQDNWNQPHSVFVQVHCLESEGA